MTFRRFALACLLLFPLSFAAAADKADLLLHNGKVVTVDKDFSIAEAIAVRDGRIVAVGKNADVLKHRGDKTNVVDLKGKTVLPGLIDSHVHSSGASMTEFDHPIPDMETIADVLDYIRGRTKVVPEGEWITLSQVFITRLKEQRYPTKAELDEAAPNHPVVFSTGPDASVNSLALKESGIDKNFKVTGRGYLERDPDTGEPTGILRSCKGILKVKGGSGKKASQEDRVNRLEKLFRDYNAVGLTGVLDRNASGGGINRYQSLLASGRLTVRVACSRGVGTGGNLEAIQKNIRGIAKHPLHTEGTPMLRIIGIKTFLDGGMLTGSAYMRKPWGISEIYSIQDPNYRGLLYISKERLKPIVQATVESGLQFTAHSVGDGAVHTLLEVYEEVNQETPIRKTRPSVTHSNFMSLKAVNKAAELGVVLDIQPAWLYLDARTLTKQFGYDRLRYFQPLATIFKKGAIAGGGSDHMQKIGSLRSVNPYNPWLGMWVTITRQAKWYDGQLHPEEALTREQAIRFYTANNAYIMFLDDQVGSLEPGKLADLIVVDRDPLTCPIDELKETQVLRTYLEGKLVHQGGGE